MSIETGSFGSKIGIGMCREERQELVSKPSSEGQKNRKLKPSKVFVIFIFSSNTDFAKNIGSVFILLNTKSMCQETDQELVGRVKDK